MSTGFNDDKLEAAFRDVFVKKVNDKVQDLNYGTGMMVEYETGLVGWVLRRDDVGVGSPSRTKGRPTFLVLSTTGSRQWLYQDKCRILTPEEEKRYVGR